PGVDAGRRAGTPQTRVLLCEICTNPLIRVPDLEVLAEIAHQAGALLVVDNTVPTPALSQPMRWGADVVIYSATKNLSGHADVIGGGVGGTPSWVQAAPAPCCPSNLPGANRRWRRCCPGCGWCG